MHGTGETFVPSVSNNYTINYVDQYGVEALKEYWEENVLTPELKELIEESGRGEIYMDSLELASYGAAGLLWGHDFKEAFRERRGYDVTPFLPIILLGPNSLCAAVRRNNTTMQSRTPWTRRFCPEDPQRRRSHVLGAV